MEGLELHAVAIAIAGTLILFTKWIFGRSTANVQVCPRCNRENTFFVRSAREKSIDICLGCADIEKDKKDDLVL